MMRSSLTALLATLCITFWAAAQATPEQVDAAIGRAQQYLLKQQKPDLLWETSAARDPKAKGYHYSVDGAQWGGRTALVTYALLASGMDWQHPDIKRAVEWLKQADIVGNYALAMRANVWAQLPPGANVRDAARRDFQLISQSMKTQGEARGMFDYFDTTRAMKGTTPDVAARNKYDHSVSQIAVLGLWALSQAGVEVPTRTWQLIDAGWRSHQAADGSWAYRIGDADEKKFMAMTAAGVATLFITQDMMAQPRNECRGNTTDVHIDRGIEWIVKNFSQISSTKVYGLYGIERIGVASGRKYLGDQDWFQVGANRLVRSQKGGGEMGSLDDTAFGLLFLARGRATVAINKLAYEVDTGDKRQAANWNQRPRDVANLVAWIAKGLERPLNWQIVNLSIDARELHDAPILYISGNQPLSFTAEEKAKLRAFADDGGLIVGHADCSSSPFAESFRKLGAELFPAYEFRDLPAAHPILTQQQYAAASWPRVPPVLAMSNQVRELMLLVAVGDPGRYWHIQAFDGADRRPYAELMANIFLYAVDKNPRYKGMTHIVKRDAKIKPKRTATVARIEHAGNWNPEPGGWRRLADIFWNTDQIDLAVKPVKLAEGALKGVKLAHLTGTEPLVLTPEAEAELKAFLAAGGTLLIDAAGGSGAFVEALPTFLAKLGVDGMGKRISIDHPLLSPADAPAPIAFRAFAFRALGRTTELRLRVATIGERPAIIISDEDLSAGLVGQAVDGVIGYAPDCATELVRRIVLNTHFPPPPATRPASAPPAARP